MVGFKIKITLFCFDLCLIEKSILSNVSSSVNSSASSNTHVVTPEIDFKDAVCVPELDQSMERQQLENAVTAGKLSAAQTTQIYLQSDSQAILNKYMDAQQQSDLFTKSQYLNNLS